MSLWSILTKKDNELPSSGKSSGIEKQKAENADGMSSNSTAPPPTLAPPPIVPMTPLASPATYFGSNTAGNQTPQRPPAFSQSEILPRNLSQNEKNVKPDLVPQFQIFLPKSDIAQYRNDEKMQENADVNPLQTSEPLAESNSSFEEVDRAQTVVPNSPRIETHHVSEDDELNSSVTFMNTVAISSQPMDKNDDDENEFVNSNSSHFGKNSLLDMNEIGSVESKNCNNEVEDSANHNFDNGIENEVVAETVDDASDEDGKFISDNEVDEDSDEDIENKSDGSVVVIESKVKNLETNKEKDQNSSTWTKLVSPKKEKKENRFKFIVEETIPQTKLIENSTKRRHEYHTQLYEMDCRLARILAQCVNEEHDCHAALKPIFPKISRRLEQASERYIGDKMQFKDERSRLLTLQRRVSSIHNKIVKNKQETLSDLQDEVFQNLQLEILEQMQPSIKLEVQKADKREGTRFRKFDAVVGSIARRFHEESATRKAATVLLQEKLDLLSQPEDRVDFLEQLQSLRMKLKEERESRRYQDKIILEDVQRTCNALKRALLEAAGGTNF